MIVCLFILRVAVSIAVGHCVGNKGEDRLGPPIAASHLWTTVLDWAFVFAYSTGGAISEMRGQLQPLTNQTKGVAGFDYWMIY